MWSCVCEPSGLCHFSKVYCFPPIRICCFDLRQKGRVLLLASHMVHLQLFATITVVFDAILHDHTHVASATFLTAVYATT